MENRTVEKTFKTHTYNCPTDGCGYCSKQKTCKGYLDPQFSESWPMMHVGP
jgi:hypothetical protein